MEGPIDSILKHLDECRICGFNAHETRKQWLQVEVVNEIVMHFLLSFISSLNFKPLFVPVEARKFWKRCLLSHRKPTWELYCLGRSLSSFRNFKFSPGNKYMLLWFVVVFTQVRFAYMKGKVFEITQGVVCLPVCFSVYLFLFRFLKWFQFLNLDCSDDDDLFKLGISFRIKKLQIQNLYCRVTILNN